MLFGTTGLGLAGPYIQRQIIDQAILGGQRERLAPLLAALILASLGRGLFLYLRGYFQERVGQQVAFDLRGALYDHLQHLTPAYYARTYTGEIMSRVTGDVERLRQFVTSGAVDLLNSVLTFLLVTVVLFRMNVPLTLLSLSVSPLLGWVVLRFDRTIRPAWRSIERQAGALSTTIQESLSGVRVVKAFAREPFEVERFRRESQEFAQTQIQASRIWAHSFPQIDFLSGLSWVLLIGVGGWQVSAGRLTVGELVAFNGYLWSLIWPVRNLGWLINLFEQSRTASDRIMEILDAPVDIQSPAHPVHLQIQGRVCFEDVSFSYDGPATAVWEAGSTGAVLNGGGQRGRRSGTLHHFSLTVEPGQRVAIVGPTGCGKSTVINLLLRLYDPSEGRITVDGVDLRQLDLTEYRRQIGVVAQETFLFSTSVRENIAFGRPNATEEEVRQAARAAQADAFIEALPHGYETVVGERGVGLSGGERQRVALARAILVNPRILILDDPTSSVDAETEEAIQEVLKRFQEGRTTFIVAQRVTTIMDADWIVVLDQGRIVQQGRHPELMAQPGVYRQLFAGQLGLPAQPRPQEQGPAATLQPGPAGEVCSCR